MNLEERLSLIPRPHEAKITRQQKIGLVVPPSPFVVPVGWEWCHTAPFEGPSIIATIFKGLGFEFEILDQRDDKNVESLKGKLSQYDLLGFFTTEDSFPYLKKVAELAKEENPQMKILLGGALVSSVPELIMNNTQADYAILGEGELTLLEFIDFWADQKMAPDKILGLAWKDHSGKTIINSLRPQMKNLDLVPFQDFSVWKRFEGKEIPEIYLSTTRGCHCQCRFCYRTHPQMAYKSPQRVKEEILYLKKWGFKHAWLNDLSFTTIPERVEKLMGEAFSVHSFSWNCFARVTEVDAPRLKVMKEHGCNIILYGFESVSQAVLDAYNKGINQNHMIKAIELTREAQIKVGGLFIVGAQEDTKESLQDMINFARRFQEVTRVKYLSILPGTPMYWDALQKGIIKDPLAHLDFLSREQSIEEDIDEEGFIMLADKISKEDLRLAYQAINRQIEVRPFEYDNEENRFLENPLPFQKRLV